jgi:outer membrane lipopolysaccharide assembly protein LptE/RlpB
MNGVRRSIFHPLAPLALATAVAAAAGLLGGCGWHHTHKPHSYDRAVSNEDQDPTYHADAERADVEVRDVR